MKTKIQHFNTGVGAKRKLVARISKSEPLILKSKPLIFRPPETRPAGAGNQWPFGRISVCLRVPKMRTKRRHAPREHYVKANTTYNIRLPVYHPYIINNVYSSGSGRRAAANKKCTALTTVHFMILLFFCLDYSPGAIAPLGHTSAQVPQSTQASGLIEYFSPSEIAPLGHSSIQVPHATQSSLIT